MNLILLSILGFIGFALLHSVLARRKVKGFLFDKFPWLPAFYRIIYVVIAVITLALWWWFIPDMQTTIYAVFPPFNWLLRVVQAAALYGLFKALTDSGASSFMGLRQVKEYMKNGILPDDYDEFTTERLNKSGSYKYMRHPLYTFSIIVMVANPVMSFKWAYMTVLFALYFWIGSYFEEKGLIRKFGDSYKRYQKQVPRFIPRLVAIKNLFPDR